MTEHFPHSNIIQYAQHKTSQNFLPFQPTIPPEIWRHIVKCNPHHQRAFCEKAACLPPLPPFPIQSQKAADAFLKKGSDEKQWSWERKSLRFCYGNGWASTAIKESRWKAPAFSSPLPPSLSTEEAQKSWGGVHPQGPWGWAEKRLVCGCNPCPQSPLMLLGNFRGGRGNVFVQLIPAGLNRACLGHSSLM